MGNNSLIEVGEEAREFTLPDQNDNEVALSNLQEKMVLLSFHPLAWTSVCRKQMKSLEKNYDRFEDLETVPLGMSVDPVPSKRAWADKLGLEKLKILSDFWPHGKVAKKYGIFRPGDGFSERANVLIGKDRDVEFTKVYETGTVPDIDEIIETISTC